MIKNSFQIKLKKLELSEKRNAGLLQLRQQTHKQLAEHFDFEKQFLQNKSLTGYRRKQAEIRREGLFEQKIKSRQVGLMKHDYLVRQRQLITQEVNERCIRRKRLKKYCALVQLNKVVH